MEQKVLFQKGRYALIERVGKEYVVACGFDGKTWEQGYYYTYYMNQNATKEKCLAKALDYYMYLTESNRIHMSRSRLEELATLFKDGLLEDDRDTAMEYFEDTCEMTKEEMEWFGITEMEDEDEAY